MKISDFHDELSISGPFEAFCQPGYAPDILRRVVKLAQCEFCHSRYNTNNLNRKRRHESGECQQ